MKTVTLKAIRKHEPCVESWEILLSSLDKTKADDTKVSLKYILDLLGLDDALWALRALPESQDSSVRLLVCDLVEPAMKYSDDPRPAEAIRVAREYARGNATSDSLEAAGSAARAAARVAAGSTALPAAGSAAWAAAESAARAAVGSAVGSAARAAALAAAGSAAWSVAGSVAGSATWAMAEDVARKDQERIFRDWLRGDS